MKFSIVVVTDDVIGARMAGPAIRAWSIASELASRGHRVVLFSRSESTIAAPSFEVRSGDSAALRSLIQPCDIVVTQGYTTLFEPWILRAGKFLVVDLYDPIHIELLEAELGAQPAERDISVARAYDALDLQMEYGDFFICASERQRDLWLGYLSAKRRVNFANYLDDRQLRRLIDVVPFGTSNEPPPLGAPVMRGVVSGIEADSQILLWAGGIYNWFDPVTLIQAVGKLSDRYPRVRLVFMGTKHPLADGVSNTRLHAAIDEARKLDIIDRHVFFLEGWVPFQDRSRYLNEADIGVSTHFLNIETAYSFRTRILDFLWAGLPIVSTVGDGFSEVIERDRLGGTVQPDDPADLARVLEGLLGSADRLAKARAAVTRVAGSYRWSEALRPLIDYCEQPYLSPDGKPTARSVGPIYGARMSARRRAGHVQAYVAINGWRRLLWRGTVRTGRAITGSTRRQSD